jgi:hypothetical protein
MNPANAAFSSGSTYKVYFTTSKTRALHSVQGITDAAGIYGDRRVQTEEVNAANAEAACRVMIDANPKIRFACAFLCYNPA